MRKAINDIRTEALAFSSSERAGLALDLIVSLDNPDDLGLEKDQEAEIKRRVQIIQESKATGCSLESVVSDIYVEYDKCFKSSSPIVNASRNIGGIEFEA
jgi:putative addiction module component (TIGR02574 family)